MPTTFKGVPVIFQAAFDLSDGAIRAVWDGSSEIQIFQDDHDDPYARMGIFDYSEDGAKAPRSVEEMAVRVRSWIWENERGREITRIVVSTASEITLLV
jgi:hypothetical protein